MERETQTTDVKAKVSRDVPVDVPHNLHLHISLEEMPENISALLTNLGKPVSQSRLKGFFKDYLPALTPIATALFTGLVAFYGIKFNDQLTRDTLDKITTEFVEKKGADPGIAALKLAAYGEKALPAVRMVLASDVDDLRTGGELIVQQMYMEETVPRDALIKEMTHDYENPALRLGVLEWLNKMGTQLEESDRVRFLTKIADREHGLGPHAENCVERDENVTFAVANTLLSWSPLASADLAERLKELALGLTENCQDSQDPNKYDRTRKASVNALTIIARSLSPDERTSLAARLSTVSSSASTALAPVIDNAVIELQKAPRKRQ